MFREKTFSQFEMKTWNEFFVTLKDHWIMSNIYFFQNLFITLKKIAENH